MGQRKSGAPHGTHEPVATDFDPTKGGTKCGAKKKQGPGYCARAAGYNTDHLGQGRCDLHGGKTPIKHGRYSKVKRKDLREHIAELELDPDPLDLTPDLHMMRALWRSLVEKKKADPLDAARLLAEATRIVERMERIRNANAISHRDLNRVMHEMGRVVDAFIEDQATRDKIRDGWLSIKLA